MTRVQLARLDFLVSLARREVLDSQASLDLREHREMWGSKELQETSAHRVLTVRPDRRVLLEILVLAVSLEDKELLAHQEQLDSKVNMCLLNYVLTYLLTHLLTCLLTGMDVNLNPRSALLFLPTPGALGGRKSPPPPIFYLEKRQICFFSTANLGPWQS